MSYSDSCSRCNEYDYDTFCIPCIIKAVNQFKAIQEKCKQYWNEPNICDAEIHAALEVISGLAAQGRKVLDETTS